MYVRAGLQSGHTFPAPHASPTSLTLLRSFFCTTFLTSSAISSIALADVVLIFLDLVCCAFQDLADQRLAASTGATSRGFLDYLGDFLETKILDGGYDLALGNAVAVADL